MNTAFQHPTDGWYQIEVPGEHLNKQTGLIQVIDAPAVASIVNRFNQEAADYTTRTGSPFPGMLIDIEHFKHDPEKESRAYGWLLEMQNRNGIPFGKIKWTGTGGKAVDGGEYRFFSTEYDPKDLVVLNSARPERVRPMRLDGLTLTNDPNNKGGMPITNRASDGIEIPRHHGFDTDEEFVAQAKRTRAQMEANLEAHKKAEENSAEAHKNEAVELSKPHLERWFRAVNEVKKLSGKHVHQALTFQQAWDMARHQYPDRFKAAFEDPSVNIITGADPDKASALVGAIANRIASASGCDFRNGWQFVREELPAIFNRMTPFPQRVTNRVECQRPEVIQNRATFLFRRLVRDEENSSRIPFSQAWQRLLNREPILAALANGELAPSDAFMQSPGLEQRINKA